MIIVIIRGDNELFKQILKYGNYLIRIIKNLVVDSIVHCPPLERKIC